MIIIFSYVNELVNSMSDSTKIGQKIIGSIDISWSLPLLNWFKVNLNRAFKANLCCGGYRGLIRDINGNWLFGYAKPLRFYYAFHTKCWRIICGLQIT